LENNQKGCEGGSKKVCIGEGFNCSTEAHLGTSFVGAVLIHVAAMISLAPLSPATFLSIRLVNRTLPPTFPTYHHDLLLHNERDHNSHQHPLLRFQPLRRPAADILIKTYAAIWRYFDSVGGKVGERWRCWRGRRGGDRDFAGS
jgi:hypothetical protein